MHNKYNRALTMEIPKEKIREFLLTLSSDGGVPLDKVHAIARKYFDVPEIPFVILPKKPDWKSVVTQSIQPLPNVRENRRREDLRLFYPKRAERGPLPVRIRKSYILVSDGVEYTVHC